MNIQEFFKLIRIRTLTAAVGPVLLGFSYAQYYGFSRIPHRTSLFHVSLLLVIAVSAQIAANIWNEYFDYKSGLDFGQKVGNSGTLVRAAASPTLLKKLGSYAATLAAALGLFLASETSWLLIPVGLFALGIAYAYSAGPYPISRTPYGELAAGVSMGLTLVLVAAYLYSGTLYTAYLIPALPSLVLVGLILLGNSTRDLTNDKAHGRRTLAILIGHTKAVRLMACSYILIAIWTLFFIWLHYLPIIAILCLLYLIPAFKSLRLYYYYSDVHSLDQGMKFTAISSTIYHILLAILLLIHHG